MRHTLIWTTIATCLLFLFTACGTQQETPLPTRAALAEIEATVPAKTGETAVTATEAQPVPLEPALQTGELESLPSLAMISDDAGLGENSTIAADTSMLAPEANDLFGAVTFNLDTTLPTDVNEAQVWRQPAVALDVNRAQAIAQRWGFTGPLFTLALPDESVINETTGLDAAPLSIGTQEFHAFDSAKSIIITDGSSYFTDNSVSFDYETPRPFDQQAPVAETALQSMGLLDFPYTLADGWGHEVWVNRVLDGMSIDYPEISAGMNENGRLAFAAYQPLDQLTAIGTYPLISAEAAWQQIQNGIDENILFNISSEPDVEASSPPSGFQYWPREYQTGQEVHLYTYPTIFLPVEDGPPPLIQALNYTVQTDDDTARALADQVGVNVHFWGMLDVDTNSLQLTGWEPLTELNPLIKNGAVQQQGEQTLLIDQEGNPFILPNAPADLADGSLVNVFAWAARKAGQAYPVLEWQGIDMQIAEASGETLAIPQISPPVAPVYEQISINDVTLAYYVYPEFKQAENGRYQQSFLLIPVWQFTGTANNRDTVQFTVQATS